MDANTFLHALRRRWMLALGMGLVVGAVAAARTVVLVPRVFVGDRAVPSSQTTGFDLHDAIQQSTQNFEILKKTQLAILKSKFVLTPALRDPGIASLSILAGEQRQGGMVAGTPRRRIPSKRRILSISLSGDAARRSGSIARRRRRQGLHDGSSRTEKRQRKLAIRDGRAQSPKPATRKSNANPKITSTSPKAWAAHGRQRDPETDLLIRDIADTQTKTRHLTSGLFQLQTDFMIAKSELERSGTVRSSSRRNAQQDPKYLYWQYQLDSSRDYATQTPASAKGGSRSGSTDRQIAQAQSTNRQYQRRLQEKVGARYAEQAKRCAAAAHETLQDHVGSMQQQLAAATKALETKRAELAKARTNGPSIWKPAEKI